MSITYLHIRSIKLALVTCFGLRTYGTQSDASRWSLWTHPNSSTQAWRAKFAMPIFWSSQQKVMRIWTSARVVFCASKKLTFAFPSTRFLRCISWLNDTYYSKSIWTDK